MKKWIILGFLFSAVALAQSDAQRYLSYIYQEKFYLDRLYNRHESSVMRLQNIVPFDLGYQDSYNYAYSPTLRNRGFYVGISQPIFRSGGILASIAYANANERYQAKRIDIEEKGKVTDVLTLLTQLKKIQLEIKRQDLLIENAMLDVNRKKEQFEAGFIDSSTLDNAILDHNQARKQAISLRTTQNNYRYELKKMSDLDDEDVLLPSIYWVNEDDYLEQNGQIQYAQLNYEQKGVQFYQSLSSFLPQVTLQARYNKDSIKNPDPSRTSKDSYTTLALNVSIPLLDVGIYNKIEGARVEELRSSLQITQVKREQQELYRKQMLEKELIKQKRQIAQEDLNLYMSLLKDSLGRSKAGDLTEHDVQIMENSKQIRELELGILDYEERLLYLELYRHM